MTTSTAPSVPEAPAAEVSPPDDPAAGEARRDAAIGLLALGFVSASIYYVVATRPFLLFDHIREPNLHIATAANYSLDDAARFALGFLALFAIYVAGYRWLARVPLYGRGGQLAVFGPALVFHLLLAVIYPIVAADMFDYVLYGRMWASGLNPLIATPNDFRPDPNVVYSPWPGEPSVYGPLWAFISVVPTVLARNDLLTGLLLFKLIAVAASLGTAYLLWRSLDAVAPDRAAQGAFLFAWNPLVVWEAAGNGHNDTVMVCLAVAGVLALVRRRLAPALVLLAASALVKFVTVLLAPFFLAYAWRHLDRRAFWRGLTRGAALSLVLAVVCYLPFWQGWSTLGFLSRRGWFTASLPTLLRHLLVERWGLSLDEAGQRAATLSSIPLGLTYLVQLGLAWRDRASYGLCRLARDTYVVYFVYLVVACTWFQAWYLLWLIPAAALLRDRRWHDLTALFGYGAMASYLWYWIWGLSKAHMDYITIMSIMVALIFPLPLAYLALAFTGAERGAEPASTADT